MWQKRETLEIESLPVYLAAMSRYAVYRFLANEKRTGLPLDWQKRQSHELADNFDLDNKQLLEILTSLTNKLPEKYRVIFIHHKLLDRPLEAVAEELGVSVRTAAVLQ